MFVAKAARDPLGDTVEFDQLVKQQEPDIGSSYIQTCKLLPRKSCCPGRNRKSSVPQVDSEDDSVMIVSPGNKELEQNLPRFKLLQFAENHRPAYYGTWRKQRGSVNPRNPLKKDEVTILEITQII